MKPFSYDISGLQHRLKKLGLYHGEVDGLSGPLTDKAVVAFKQNNGLRARPYVGPKTWAMLAEASKFEIPPRLKQSFVMPPWVSELNKVLGLHETRDNKELREWLRSDGRTVGDPDRIAWCGDAAETCIHNSLPDEPVVEPLNGNPYWARNWQHFGVACGRVYGAMVPMVRGGGGHITTLVGVSQDGTKIMGRGGNQGDTIKDSWFDAEMIYEGGRIIDYRWPLTYPVKFQFAPPVLSRNGAVISRNEA